MSEQTSRLAIIIDSTGAEKNAENLTTALSGLTEWGMKAAASAGKVKKTTEEESAALSELLDRIDPVNAALNKLDKQQQQLAKFKSKDMLDDEDFDVYSKKIDEARNRLTGFSDQLKNTGMSAKQTAFAMRLVPMQMTDIVTSLAAGQPPLMVLLQQGGQLKDMFGGIIPALKGVSTYVMGLVNPFTVAAASVGLLTYAIYQNRQEIDAATKIATTSLGANGDAAERLALNMVAISDKTGQAIDEVGSMFITTNDGASEAINKLIDVGYSYDSARKEVDKYKESGNFTALNAEIDRHRREILKIGDAWTDAAIKEKHRYTGANLGRQNPALGGAIDYGLKFIEQGIDLQKTMNQLRIEGNEHVRATIENINKEYLSVDRVASAEKRLSDARTMAKEISASGDAEAISNSNKLIAAREKELKQAKEQASKTPKTPKGKAVTEDAGQRMIDQLNQQNALLVTQAEATNKLSSSEQELIKWRQQLSTLETRSPSQLTTAQKSLLLRKDEITSLMERNAQQEKNNRLMKEATELASYRSTLERGLENLRASYAVQDSGFGMGEKEQKRMQDLLQLDQKYNAQRQQLDRDYADKSKGMSEETYNAKALMLTDALNREKEIMLQHYASLDAMNNDWQGGIEQGFRNWMDTASTYSTQMSGVVQGAMSGLVDTMADGLSGSKADWNEWSMSVLKSLQKVLLNAMIVNGIKSMQGAGIWGSLFGSANSGGSTPSGAYGSASSGLDFFKQNAKGGVYNSPSLSAYSGGVFDSPKLFAFAKGAGVFGEAGPEAIMPLARTPDGNLGVRMMGEQGGGFSGDIIVQQTIHVSGNGDAALNRAMEEAARKGANDGARQARQEMLQDFQSRGQGRRLLGV
ncbi:MULTISPECIES: phage tail tape measure protein [Citrobacter]|uniref:Phage tail tape measure protein n=1 Tax=Citrobacter pasteurii TaxID=1563222 RepID=A0ABX8K3I9_9ENTR|nr:MULTISPECIES: phage tail tape measure protein [Citrobacter]QXA43390.1 phage tail tape measure protein [Citrobacter pasteurii]TKU59484.1 phage tail tape measure protein [Citrobacter sp. wls715]CEJ67061.1 Phage tail length tape-measure protein 1 [Citrobacter pasteurii]